MALQLKKSQQAKPRSTKGKAEPKPASANIVPDMRGKLTKQGKPKAKPAKRKVGKFGVTAGTKKERTAIMLDAKGLAETIAAASTLAVKESSIRSWAGDWRRRGLWLPQTDGEAKS